MEDGRHTSNSNPGRLCFRIEVGWGYNQSEEREDEDGGDFQAA